MATVEELDTQISQREQELGPLAQSAEAAQDRCLERFADALAAITSEHARKAVIADPSTTQELIATGRLATLKAAVADQVNGSGEQVETCLRSAEVWIHRHPEKASSTWDFNFKPYNRASDSALHHDGWSAALRCLSQPLSQLFARHGYGQTFYLGHVAWPPEVWEALGLYSTSARAYMSVRKEINDLQAQRATVMAANAWDSDD